MTYISEKGFKDNEDHLLSERKVSFRLFLTSSCRVGEIVCEFLLQSSRDDEDPEDSITQ